MMASPTRMGEAELVNSSSVGREFTCFPSFNDNTTATELESGVNSAASSIVNGCEEMRPGNCLFQSIVPLLFRKYAKLSNDETSSMSPVSVTASTPAPVRLRHFKRPLSKLTA